MPFVDCRHYEVRPVFDGYDGWAPTYDDGANALLALEAPVVEALLGEVAERDVLDLGCGTGRHLQRLVARGARVVGVDAGASRERWRCFS